MSARGARNVAEGLNATSSSSILEGFDFNARATFGSVLNSIVTVDTATGSVSIAAYNPLEQMRSPEGATHFSLQVGFLRIDFATGAYELTQSAEEVYPLQNGMITPVLTPATVPTVTGTGMHFILIEFFQEVNGVQYMLNNGAFNVLNLLKMS
uniref:hypothetical protein n=1 Tax=Flavobacterium sp. TaxID=239 RepID=UPI00404B71F6